MARTDDPAVDIHGATLTRRQFVRAGGTLVVGFSLVGTDVWATPGTAAAGTNTLDPTLPGSWIEIHADGAILIRTGKVEFGQSTVTTAYRQIVAEELSVPFEAITTVVAGDTDRTPDGGATVDLLGRGAPNLRKAAAYLYQALQEVAANRLGVAKEQLSVQDGVIFARGTSVSYGELVQGQALELRIPVSGSLGGRGLTVTGDPPTRAVSRYAIVGRSYDNPETPAKVTAREGVWATDVRLPGMLHARVVHPRTLGSTLVTAGTLDEARYPNAQVAVQGNLVGVLAPTEWEAIGAARQVAADTTWTDWQGLPGSGELFGWLQAEADWRTTPVTTSDGSTGGVERALATATTVLSASYELPYIKHAPIGPTMAVADARPDGTVWVYTHNQHPQALREQIALMLGTSVDVVVVRSFGGAGHYGRSNGGSAGGEDEAVLLSKAVGRPVRVQWSRDDDFLWSTQSAANRSHVRIGLDATGRIVGYHVDHYMPAMQDSRPVGALVAGLPTMPPPSPVNAHRDPWLYDRVEHLVERAHGTLQVGQEASPLAVGLRDHSLRTPGQRQQNYPRELAISEAAALAGLDGITFRLNHTTDERLIGVLEAVRRASGWETRPSPGPAARASGSVPVTGQGASVMVRKGGYWACVCQVSVVPDTGRVSVTRYTIALDLGIVVNPRQLKRQVEGGAVMGISHALHEEVTFDRERITSRDWRTYPIMTMADLPEIEVVLIDRPDIGRYAQGSETANALAAPAIAAAFHDATGKVARRLPLKPAYVRAVLSGQA